MLLFTINFSYYIAYKIHKENDLDKTEGKRTIKNVNSDDVASITLDEIGKAHKRIKNKEIFGHEGVLAELLKVDEDPLLNELESSFKRHYRY